MNKQRCSKESQESLVWEVSKRTKAKHSDQRNCDHQYRGEPKSGVSGSLGEAWASQAALLSTAEKPCTVSTEEEKNLSVSWGAHRSSWMKGKDKNLHSVGWRESWSLEQYSARLQRKWPCQLWQWWRRQRRNKGSTFWKILAFKGGQSMVEKGAVWRRGGLERAGRRSGAHKFNSLPASPEQVTRAVGEGLLDGTQGHFPLWSVRWDCDLGSQGDRGRYTFWKCHWRAKMTWIRWRFSAPFFRFPVTLTRVQSAWPSNLPPGMHVTEN